MGPAAPVGENGTDEGAATAGAAGEDAGGNWADCDPGDWAAGLLEGGA